MYEYTVTEPFTLPMNDQGAVKVFKAGDHITDPDQMKAVEARFSRQVSRHYAIEKPAPKAPPPAPAKPAT